VEEAVEKSRWLATFFTINCEFIQSSNGTRMSTAGPYIEGGGGGVNREGGRPQGSHKNIFLHILLGKAKYFITILTRSLCGAAKLLFYHYVRFFLPNWPKMCILWACLSVSDEMAGKRLGESSFSKLSNDLNKRP
jgi:hypothetical protein